MKMQVQNTVLVTCSVFVIMHGKNPNSLDCVRRYTLLRINWHAVSYILRKLNETVSICNAKYDYSLVRTDRNYLYLAKILLLRISCFLNQTSFSYSHTKSQISRKALQFTSCKDF